MERHHKIKGDKKNHARHAPHKEERIITAPIITLVILAAAIILFNQFQISSISGMLTSDDTSSNSALMGRQGSKDLANINIADLKSTGHSVAALFPVEDVKTQEDAISVIIATGTPEYGDELGVSFDDPVNSLNFMARELYPRIKQDIKQNYPEIWQRYIDLVTKPVGISCEFCCGLNAVAVRPDGELMCGCQHNPAMHGLVLWLMQNTDYSDVEILKEALKWKALWYPKDMVKLTLQVAGGDTSSLEELPGMVGGC